MASRSAEHSWRPGEVEFRILGSLEVWDGQRLAGLGRPKQRALLAVLLVHADQVVALDRLIEELWGQQPPAQATASLQTYVSNLRRVLEPGRPARTPLRVLVTQPPGYRLVVAPGELDAARFVALAAEGHRLLGAGRPGAAARAAGGAWAVARAGAGGGGRRALRPGRAAAAGGASPGGAGGPAGRRAGPWRACRGRRRAGRPLPVPGAPARPADGGAVPLGWAQAVEGDPAGGAARLRQALARSAETGAQATRPLLLGLLAEAEQLAGRPAEALRLLDDALAQASRSGERYCEAELHRLKGESLVAGSPPQAAAAEAAFRTSVAVARRQGAKLLEGRAAASLGRLRAAQRPQSPR